MSHNAITWLIIAGRVLSGCGGLLALYAAFFLFEDEEGRLQNRLEEVWVGIHDRAKQRGSTTAALLNSAGAKMDALMNRIFGKRLFGANAITTSLNLSAFGMVVAGAVIDVWRMGTFAFHSLPSFMLLSGLCLYAAICTPSPRTFVVKVLPIIVVTLVVGMVQFQALATLPSGSDTAVLLEAIMLTGVTMTLSILSDIGVIVLIRRLSRYLAKHLSVVRLSTALSVLLLIPTTTALMFLWALQQRPAPSSVSSFVAYVAMMNLTTAFFSLIPIAVIVGLLFHLIAWPVLSKLLYPGVRYGLVGSRKTLAAIAVVAFTFAFNLEHDGAKELLKLFA